MKTVLILFSCFFLLSCTTRMRKAEAVHSPYDTVSVYAKDEEGQKIYNVVSEKAVTANGDSLFDKRRAEVPKQLSDKEFELAKTLVRRYVDSHQDSYLPFDSYFQQYLGYKKAGVLMADVALFSSYKIVYQKGVACIIKENYKVTFKYLKDLGKERKMLTINLDKGVIVRE